MSPKRKVAILVKVALQTDFATPAPSVGTTLGPHGVNVMGFVKAYNVVTEPQRGNVTPVEITIYKDRTLIFITKAPPAAELIKKATGTQLGLDNPLKDKVSELTKDQVRGIVMIKLPGLSTNSVDAACKTVEGTAHSIGITVE